MKNLTKLLAVGLLCIACNVSDLEFDDLKGPTLIGDVAVPLGRLHYTMRELVDKINDDELQLTEDSTTLLMMIYRDTAEFANPTDLIEISDVSNTVSIALSEMSGDDAVPVFIHHDIANFKYPASKGEQIDSIAYKGGEISLEVTKTFPYDIDYTLEVRNTTHEITGEPVTFNSGAGQVNAVHLADYETVLFLENDTNRFIVDISFSIELQPGESLTSSDQVTFNLLYSNQEFDAVYGKFGRDTLQVGNEVLNVNFFKDLGNSGLKFGDPQIIFNFQNGFGIPVGLNFAGLFGAKGDNLSADTTYLSGDVARVPQVVSGADISSGSVSSTVSINSRNSNIRDLLSVSPDKIGFSLSAISNPVDASASNFVLDTSRIETTIEMRMPMVLSLDDLTQEIKFDNKGGLKFDESDSMYIRILSENELPFSAMVQLEIRDENDSVLHALDHQIVLAAPYVSQDGIVTGPRKASADFFVSREGIEAFNDGKKLVLILTLNSSGSSPSRDVFVKVLADYALDLQLSAVGRLKYEIK